MGWVGVTELDRQAKERKQYLARATDLEEKHAEALAWRELGYSHAGVADKVDSSKSTVSTWLDRVAVQYGPAAVETKVNCERDDDLTEVTREEIMAYPDETVEWWSSIAEDHPDATPDWFDRREDNV